MLAVLTRSSDQREDAMAGPKSISIKQLAATAKRSVESALPAHQAAFPKPNYVLGFVPPWWIGIVIRNPVETATLGAAQKFATDIHRGVSGSVPGAGAPGVLYGPGHIICGFIAPPDVVLEE
jgi:hypothetical protein